MSFNKVTARIADELANIVGPRQIIWQDAEKTEKYSHDETAGDKYVAMPEIVVKPETAGEVSEVLKLANRERIPVTPRGAGSGLSCGAVPVFGGISLSLERMNRILEIDETNMTVTAEPGVVTNEMSNAVQEKGLFFAGYPMSLETCFIGGNLAENAGGGKAVKYGVTGRYVLGAEFVLPTGEIIELGGKRVKDVTGYDLLHLLVGSEGTLGVFTKAIIKLLPLPKSSVSLLVLFRTVEQAIRAVPTVMTQSGIIPTAVEFMDELSFKTSCRYLNESLAQEGAGALLLVELDGSNVDRVERDYDSVGELLLANGAMEVYVADNHTTHERIWRIRRNIAEAFKLESPVHSLEDVVVPTAQIPELMPHLERISRKYSVKIPCYGHAGDGNLHATIVKGAEMSIDAWDEALPKILSELYEAVARLGGTISGEHGIGSKRSRYLPLVLQPETIELLKRIKAAFDPNWIMNPGKIFD
jgi:glycolate oxidase